VAQLQSSQVQFAQLSVHDAHRQLPWLQVEHVQSAQSHRAQESVQFAHSHAEHSS
jgi:hypothetical protein